MPTRRTLLLAALAAAAIAPAARAASPAETASAFIEQTGKQLLAIVNNTASAAGRQADLQRIVDSSVDVDAVAKFCLGRFWRTATPEQQAQYLQLFHRVLLKNITGKLGDYQGVTFTIGRTVPRDDAFGVATVIMRPNTPAANVEWIVSTASGAPRIIDVIAEGTSLRLTQRSDYAAFLAHNNNDIGVLLAAMKHQLDTPA